MKTGCTYMVRVTDADDGVRTVELDEVADASEG